MDGVPAEHAGVGSALNDTIQQTGAALGVAILGSVVYDLACDISKRRMDTWAGWEQVSRAAEKAIPAPNAEPA